MNTMSRLWSLAAVVAILAIAALPSTTSANHSWGNYHWARTSNPFTVKLGDNLTSNWKSYLGTASTDWSKSRVLDTTVVAGQSTSRCAATSGRVEVCNSTYGSNGWLGIASVWTSGGHIVQGTVKMNDTYYNTATYNTPAWRNLVMCQEVGHTFGLAHQDENFDNPNLGTCMDYTNDPSSNQHPNSHDYQMLESIYSHVDGTTTVSALPADVANADLSTPDKWGKPIHTTDDGHGTVHERDFGNGYRIFTFVYYAEPRGHRDHH